MLAFPHLPFALDDGRAALPRSALGRRQGEERLGALAVGRAARRGRRGRRPGGAARDDRPLRRAERGVRAAPVPALPRPPAPRQHARSGRPTSPAACAAGARTTRACTSTPFRRTRCRARGCCASSRNVNPNGEPRRWRVGEPFEAHARRYFGVDRPAAAGLGLADGDDSASPSGAAPSTTT